jgi:hypothetical protein
MTSSRRTSGGSVTDISKEQAEILKEQYRTLHRKIQRQYTRRDAARQDLDTAITHGGGVRIASSFSCYCEVVLQLYELKLDQHCVLTKMKKANVQYLWLTQEHDPNQPATPY